MLAGGTFFDSFDALSIATALTVIVKYFGISLSTAGLIVSAGYLGQLVGALVVGALSERIGRRRAFIAAIVVFSALSIGAALSWSATSLLVFRMLQGLGLGAEVPIAGTLLNEFLSARHRGRIGLLYESAFTWGILIAPLAGVILIGGLGPGAGWRWLFALGALPLLLAVVAWWRLPESPRWLAEHGRAEEAERIVARIEANARERGDELPAYRPAPPQAAHRLRPAELFAAPYRRRTGMLWATWFFTYFITYGFSVWLPTLYVQLGGLSPSRSLVLTVILGVAQLIAAYVGVPLVDRIGRMPLLLAGFIIMAVGCGFGTLGVSVLNLTAWPVLFTAGITTAVGATFPAILLYLYTAELYPTRMRGWGTAAGSSMNRLASILSPILVGQILSRGGGVTAVFSAFLLAALIGLAVLAVTGIETRNRPLEEIAR